MPPGSNHMCRGWFTVCATVRWLLSLICRPALERDQPDFPQAVLMPPADAPCPVPQAPTLQSAVPPGEPLPASLVHAGLLVLRTADPYGKAAITHAAWSAYQQGQLPLHPGDQEQQQQQGECREEAQQQQQQQQQQGEGGLPHAPAAHPSLAHLIPAHPARPERPRLVRPKDVSREPSRDADGGHRTGPRQHGVKLRPARADWWPDHGHCVVHIGRRLRRPSSLVMVALCVFEPSVQ